MKRLLLLAAKILLVQCTDCRTTYLYDGTNSCPKCGSDRRNWERDQ